LFLPRPVGTRVGHPLRSLRGQSLHDSPSPRCRATSSPLWGTPCGRTIYALPRYV